MNSTTLMASPIIEEKNGVKSEFSPPVQEKISAYYSLVFPHFAFYIQTLSITIGRRCAPNSSTATSSTTEPVQVDVDLGALKSVSRLHAKIEYDQEEDRFVLVVIGRNGAWVDGVWSGSGTRAPLSERSQIQIASRIFHFVLPPPPPPEDTPSPSSQSSSANRQRSPSVDITSISPPSSQPSNSPLPSDKVKLSPNSPEPQLLRTQRQPELPNSNSIGKPSKATNSKKRKKSDNDSPPVLERPKPEDMPPKPPFTYAQLIYRAIKSLNGKATLQEICSWILNIYDYYRYADGAWMSSVRHNLSSSRAFLKMERCGGDRGKGFFWSIDEKHARTLEEQETRSQQAANDPSQANASGSKDGPKGGRKKDKGASLLEPPLKRSIKGDAKGPLPPPLTSAPLLQKIKTDSPNGGNSTNLPTVYAYPPHKQQTHVTPASQQASTLSSGYSGTPQMTPNPYAALTHQSHWSLHSSANKSGSSTSPSLQASTAIAPTQNPTPHATSQRFPLVQTLPQQAVAAPPPSGATVAPDVVIPIVLGPIPPTHPDYASNQPNNSAKEGYMVLHERKLILDPDVFAGLTKEMLEELEKMGARAALVVLTGHMVRALKERRARGRGKDKSAKRAKGSAKAGAAKKAAIAATSGPFTTLPLENRTSCVAATRVDADSASGEAQQPSAEPNSIPETAAAPVDGDPGTPIVVVDDSEDEEPAAKRRKLQILVDNMTHPVNDKP